MLPELASEAPAAEPQGDAEQARFRLFDAVAALLKDSARAHPLLIVIDDLHEADLPSLNMLKFAVRALHDAPVLIIGTYREAEMRRSLEHLRAIEEALRDGYQMPLSGLAEAEVGRMVEARSDQPPSAEFVALLHRATSGNPLFVDGVLRVLAAEGRLGANERIDLTGFKLPDNVRGAIARRLEMLSPEARSVLVTAAIVGDEFELDLVSRVSARPSETASKLIREAEDLGIVSRVAHGRWRFSHPLLREWLVNEPAAPERVALHRAVGEAIEEMHRGDLTPHLVEMAYHFREAAEVEKAIDYSIRAGEAAGKTFAFEEAVAQWQMALEVMEKHAVSMERRARHLYALGDLCTSVSNETAITYLEKAISLSAEAGDLEQAAQAHIRLGEVFSVTNFGKRGDANTMNIDRAMEHYRAAEKILSGGPAKESLVSLYAGLAIAGWEALRVRDAIAFSRHAVELAENLDLPRAWFHAALFQSVSLTANGRMAEAKSLIEKMEGKAAAVHDTLAQIHLAYAKVRHYMFGGDPMAAAEWHRRIVEWKGLPDTMRATERQYLAVTLARLGHLQEACEIRAKFGLPKIMDAIVARLEGRWLDSESLLDGALEEVRDTGSRWDIATVSLDRGRLNRIMGQFEAAESALLESIQMTAGEQVQEEFDARTELALVYAETGRPALTEPHLSRCYEIVKDEDLLSGAGFLARAEGVIAALNGRSVEADQLLAKSVKIFQKYHLPFQEAETNVYWGQASLAARESSRSKEHFDAAVQIYRSIGAGQAWLDRVERQRTRALAASHESPSSIFRKEGDYWVVGWNSATFRLKDAKGLRYLAPLLHNPGRDFHAAELIAFAAPGNVAASSDLGDAGAILDQKAKAAYKRRLIELRSELEDAEHSNDLHRAETLRAEIESITEQLAAAVGLGGRDRLAVSHAESARSAATTGIKKSIERIRANNPDLGRHLATFVHTGNFCRYRPDRDIRWLS